MARFKRSGTNWEGRKWSLPKSMHTLLDEIEAWQPLSRPADGTVASKTHDANSPNSDHRPKPISGAGIVRAADAGEFDPEGNQLAEALRKSKDKRIKYVIHEKQIFASYSNSFRKAWEWGKYTGYNAHLNHVHVSLVTAHDNDGTAWNLGLSTTTKGDPMLGFTIGKLGAPSVGGPAGDPIGDQAQALQLALLKRGEKLPQFGADRFAGDETRNALRSFQSKNAIATTHSEYTTGTVGPNTHAALYAVAGGSGTVGPPGPAGPKGATGPAGPKGGSGTLTIKGDVTIP